MGASARLGAKTLTNRLELRRDQDILRPTERALDRDEVVERDDLHGPTCERDRLSSLREFSIPAERGLADEIEAAEVGLDGEVSESAQ